MLKRYSGQSKYYCVNSKSSFTQYFVDYKMSSNYTGVASNYDTNFLAYLGVAAQIPNVGFGWLNIFLNLR